jgi:PhnB protein
MAGVPLPEGYHTVNPYIVVDGAERPCVHYVYVDDVDATYRAALAAGARSILEPTDQSYGDRTCGFVDPFDNRWWVATHLREFS